MCPKVVISNIISTCYINTCSFSCADLPCSSLNSNRETAKRCQCAMEKAWQFGETPITPYILTSTRRNTPHTILASKKYDSSAKHTNHTIYGQALGETPLDHTTSTSKKYGSPVKHQSHHIEARLAMHRPTIPIHGH